MRTSIHRAAERDRLKKGSSKICTLNRAGSGGEISQKRRVSEGLGTISSAHQGLFRQSQSLNSRKLRTFWRCKVLLRKAKGISCACR